MIFNKRTGDKGMIFHNYVVTQLLLSNIALARIYVERIASRYLGFKKI